MNKMYQATSEIVFGDEHDAVPEQVTCGHWHASAVEAIRCLVAHGWHKDTYSDDPYVIRVRIESLPYDDILTLGEALSVAAREQHIGEDIVVDSDDESDLACAKSEAIENFKRSLLGGKR
jgi:hypothetical protein